MIRRRYCGSMEFDRDVADEERPLETEVGSISSLCKALSLFVILFFVDFKFGSDRRSVRFFFFFLFGSVSLWFS